MKSIIPSLSVALLCIFLSGCASMPNRGASYFYDSGPQRELLKAAGRGNVTGLEKQLRLGADINRQGRDGMTALIWALLKSNKTGYAWLLAHGANPNLQMPRNYLRPYTFFNGLSAISLASQWLDVWFLEETLKHGGNPNLVNPIDGYTPIFDCMSVPLGKYSMIEHLKLLIKYGADLNIIKKNGISTPMRWAASSVRYDMVYIMLEAGADPTIVVLGKWSLLNQMKITRTVPGSPQDYWRKEVIKLLRSKGIEFTDDEIKKQDKPMW